jgi:outer membrane receptor protein involved in Fe transport
VDESGQFLIPTEENESFIVVNAGIGWRYPGRGAVASLQVTNLFNADFRFQDVERQNPAYFPHRMILGRITFSF